MSLPPNIANHVRSYLTGPEVDLQTVSAKQIRKKLATVFPDLDIKALRSEIDEISIPIFHEIKESVESGVKPPTQEPPANPPLPANSSNPSQLPIKPDIKPTSSFPPLALPPRGTPGVVKTANPQPVRPVDQKPPQPSPASTTSRAAKATSTKSKKRKSAAYVDTDDEDGSSGKKTGRDKKPRIPKEGEGPGSNKGIHVELNCSPALSDVIGVPMCSRPQMVKKIWAYIKANELQNPNDKRQILCDDALKKLFNTNSVNMFTMNKLLASHLFKPEEVLQTPLPPPTQSQS